MIALDASVLIAFLRPDDPHHDRARDLILADSVLEVHGMNLAEALVAPARARRDHQAMEAWLAVGVRRWCAFDEEPLALARLRVETRLRLPDCCPLLVAETGSGRLATFDTRLAREARSRSLEVLGV